MDNNEPKARDWQWRYSFLTGIMYGPIPVGLIIVAIVFVGYFAYKFLS